MLTSVRSALARFSPRRRRLVNEQTIDVPTTVQELANYAELHRQFLTLPTQANQVAQSDFGFYIKVTQLNIRIRDINKINNTQIVVSIRGAEIGREDIDLSQADLTDVNFDGSKFYGPGINFAETNLSGVNLSHCRLESCNLRQAILDQNIKVNLDTVITDDSQLTLEQKQLLTEAAVKARIMSQQHGVLVMASMAGVGTGIVAGFIFGNILFIPVIALVGDRSFRWLGSQLLPYLSSAERNNIVRRLIGDPINRLGDALDPRTISEYLIRSMPSRFPPAVSLVGAEERGRLQRQGAICLSMVPALIGFSAALPIGGVAIPLAVGASVGALVYDAQRRFIAFTDRTGHHSSDTAIGDVLGRAGLWGENSIFPMLRGAGFAVIAAFPLPGTIRGMAGAGATAEIIRGTEGGSLLARERSDMPPENVANSLKYLTCKSRIPLTIGSGLLAGVSMLVASGLSLNKLGFENTLNAYISVPLAGSTALVAAIAGFCLSPRIRKWCDKTRCNKNQNSNSASSPGLYQSPPLPKMVRSTPASTAAAPNIDLEIDEGAVPADIEEEIPGAGTGLGGISSNPLSRPKPEDFYIKKLRKIPVCLDLQAAAKEDGGLPSRD